MNSRWFAWIFLVALGAAQWSTHYSFDDGRIYLRLLNNDLVALNFSVTGFSDLAQNYLLSDVNLANDQSVSTLALPPVNSSLFVHGTTLYAMTASTKSDKLDVCGNGILLLVKYDLGLDSWVSATDSLTFLGVSDTLFYQSASYFLSPTDSTVYIYGGQCERTGTASSRMISLDMSTFAVLNISTSAQPQAFYGAASLWAPGPGQTLIVGGNSNLGWLSMLQLAQWSFSSGWLSQDVSGDVSSRVDALVLPVFGPVANSSEFLLSYRVLEVIMMGGKGRGQLQGEMAKVSLNGNLWVWEDVESKIEVLDILGGAIIFDTLVTVKSLDISGSQVRRDMSGSPVSKRATPQYSVNLWSVSGNFSTVNTVKENTSTKLDLSSSSSSSAAAKATKIAVGTLVPVAALAIASAVGIFLYKKRKDLTNDSEVHTIDYQLGHFRTALDRSYSVLVPEKLYAHGNDLALTLDGASLDSWVKKRQEYDSRRLRLQRNSFMASTETLNQHLLESDSPRNSSEVETEKSLDIVDLAESTSHPETAESPALPIRVQKLQKSFSYTQTPPQLPSLLKTTRLDPGYIDVAELGITHENIDDSEESCDDSMDVQVLVSSKRKLVLRVMNPDSCSEEIRLRTPSQ